MDAQTLAAWLHTRLTQPSTQPEYRALLEGVVAHVLDKPLNEMLPESAAMAAFESHLNPERLTDGARFFVREVVGRAISEAHTDQAPVERWLSADAKARLLDFAARPGWADEVWVEQLFQQKAMEALVSDTLYRALKDFSTIVPRIVQGVLPSGLGRLAKFGGKATGGVGGRVFDEVERKLEAEIKRFLDKGTRKALESAASFAIERMDSPESAQAQRMLATFALAQSPAFHVRPFDEPTLEALEAVAVDAAASIGAHEELQPLVQRVVRDFYKDWGPLPLKEALQGAGVDPQGFEVGAWADASWPALVAAMATPPVRTFLLDVSNQILEQIEKDES